MKILIKNTSKALNLEPPIIKKVPFALMKALMSVNNDNMIEAVRQAQEHQESIEISSKDSMPEEFDSSEISGRDITLRATYDNELIGVMKDLDLDLAQKKINEMKKKSYNCK